MLLRDTSAVLFLGLFTCHLVSTTKHHTVTCMIYLQWCFLACLLYLPLGLNNQAPSRDLHDLSALKEFAGNLTKGSIITAWSNDTVCCNWVGVVCDNATGGDQVVSARNGSQWNNNTFSSSARSAHFAESIIKS